MAVENVYIRLIRIHARIVISDQRWRQKFFQSIVIPTNAQNVSNQILSEVKTTELPIFYAPYCLENDSKFNTIVLSLKGYCYFNQKRIYLYKCYRYLMFDVKPNFTVTLLLVYIGMNKKFSWFYLYGCKKGGTYAR